jgi:succinate dehydrogenase (ubiquinone) cytochrome b560 subunit
MMTPSEGHSILEQQRLRRPTSPHLAIYRLQINYFTSPFHRITGCFISGSFYIFGISYLAAPFLGWHIDTATIAATFGAWPVAAKIAAKFAFAVPFVFHCVNGVGHLIWDTGRRFSTRQIVQQGWTVVGLSLVGASWLAVMV